MGFMLSCKETSELIIKKETEDLKLYDRIRLMMHISMCKFCSLFEKQNVFINSNIRALDDNVIHEFPEDSKARVYNNLGNK